jgi:hypothetical protein
MSDHTSSHTTALLRRVPVVGFAIPALETENNREFALLAANDVMAATIGTILFGFALLLPGLHSAALTILLAPRG